MAPILALALALMASDVRSVTVQSPPPSAPAEAQADPDKVVCRMKPITGSRITKRVCMTQARWDAWSKQSDAYLYNLQRQATLGMPHVQGQLN